VTCEIVAEFVDEVVHEVRRFLSCSVGWIVVAVEDVVDEAIQCNLEKNSLKLAEEVLCMCK